MSCVINMEYDMLSVEVFNMLKSIVRLQKAELNNFKNVEYGSINFACNTKQDIFENSSDILGIYGQNGSGKTAFIRSLLILDALLSGNRLPKDILNYITVGKDVSNLVFEMSITNNISYYKTKYEFSFQKRNKDFIDAEDEDQNPVIISREKLSFSTLENDKWSKLQTIIDYNYDDKELFSPKVKFSEITNQNKNVIDELRVAKKYAIKQSTSFIFSKDTMKQIMNSCPNQIFKDIIGGLSDYGKLNLYIVDNRNTGLINANIALPFSFRINEKNSLSIGIIPIQLNSSSVIPEEVFTIISGVIETMNIVLCKIIPGLSIMLVDLGKQLMPDNKTGIIVELVSIRDEKKIPLKYESDGIKKIISILHMLISMYNNPSMTLAIDELDSGIFEYLLGEILKILDESAKGQLIFTSHNLRPLETLHKKSIIFTTANPQNSYIRLANVKTNNNFRDVYYHDIILGGQKECIYDPTNSFAIGRAFRMAGEVNEG